MRTRRVMRIFFLALACLVLLLYFRSRQHHDVAALFVGSEGRTQALVSADGRIMLLVSTIGFGPERSWTSTFLSGERIEDLDFSYDGQLVHQWSRFGIVAAYGERGVISPNDRFALIGVPNWLAALLLAAWPAWSLIRARRRFAAGLCQKCGYDLRASTDRCPECGTPVPTSSPAASPQ